jgi:hypothetical protein
MMQRDFIIYYPLLKGIGKIYAETQDTTKFQIGWCVIKWVQNW